jgi:excisionase family DNA binding protein
MASLAMIRRPARKYGSPADVAAYLGLSLRGIRRLVATGEMPSYAVGRRRLVAFADADAFMRSRRRTRPVATIHRDRPGTPGPSFVPAIGGDELGRRNAAAIALLDSWEADGDEDEQRQTMEALARALGPGRVASSRPLLP